MCILYTSASRQVSALLYDQSVTEFEEWWMVDMFVHSLHGTYQSGMHHLLAFAVHGSSLKPE